MKFTDVLSPELAIFSAPYQNKKPLFQYASELLSEAITEEDAATIFKGLIDREKLGSTAMGHGVALPHCKVGHLNEVRGCFIHCKKPFDFGAADHEPVDLFFFLALPQKPTTEQLKILTELTQLFRQSAFRKALRACEDNECLYQTIINFAG